VKNYQNIGKILERLGNLAKPYATLDDILLLFICLELGAMAGIFFRTHYLPVIFLLFISMTALPRYLVIDLKSFDNMKILTIVSAILLLSVAALILRFAENRFMVKEEGLSRKHQEE
jgi:protein PsiE